MIARPDWPTFRKLVFLLPEIEFDECIKIWDFYLKMQPKKPNIFIRLLNLLEKNNTTFLQYPLP